MDKDELNEEYINETQNQLRKINLDIDEVETIFNEITTAIANRKVSQSYLVIKYLAKYIENFVEYPEEDIRWFDFVANRCLILKKKDEKTNSFEGIN